MFISFVVLGGLDVKCLVMFFEFWIQFTFCLDVPQIQSEVFIFWQNGLPFVLLFCWKLEIEYHS